MGGPSYLCVVNTGILCALIRSDTKLGLNNREKKDRPNDP